MEEEEIEGEGEEEATPAEGEEAEEKPAEAEEKPAEADPKAADPKAEPPPAKTTLDAIMGADWLREQLQLAGDKELPLTEEELRDNPVAQRAIANMVLRGKSGAAAAMAAAEQQKQREADLAARERMLLAKQSEALRFFNNPKIKAFREESRPKGERPDPDSPEGRDWDARDRFSALMDGFFKTLEETEQEATQRATEAEEAAKTAATQAENEQYVAANIEDFRDPEMFALIEEHVRAGHTLQRAHKTAKAEILAAAVDKDQAEQLATARRRVQPGRRTRSAIPDTPKDLSPVKLNEWYDKHPDALKRDLAEFERRGVGF